MVEKFYIMMKKEGSWLCEVTIGGKEDAQAALEFICKNDSDIIFAMIMAPSELHSFIMSTMKN